MAEQRRFEVGDKVRDSGQLGGEVIAVWGDAVKVRWEGGFKNWIAGARIRLQHDKSARADQP